jgi:hypothetical protein
MPPSLLQGGGREAAELRELTGRFPPPAGYFPPKFVKIPFAARAGAEGRHHG